MDRFLRRELPGAPAELETERRGGRGEVRGWLEVAAIPLNKPNSRQENTKSQQDITMCGNPTIGRPRRPSCGGLVGKSLFSCGGSLSESLPLRAARNSRTDPRPSAEGGPAEDHSKKEFTRLEHDCLKMARFKRNVKRPGKARVSLAFPGRSTFQDVKSLSGR